MGTSRTIGTTIFCMVLAVWSASLSNAQKLSEEEPVEGSGRYAGPSQDDEDFAVEGSGQPVDSSRTLRPTWTPVSSSSSSVSHRGNSAGDDKFVKAVDSFRVSDDHIDNKATGSDVSRTSTLVVISIVALICLLVVVIVALTCCCSRRPPTSEYMPGTTRSKTYV